jgi:hypothetical protein
VSRAAAITANPSSDVKVRTCPEVRLERMGSSLVRLTVRGRADSCVCCAEEAAGASPHKTSNVIALLGLSRMRLIMMLSQAETPVTLVLRQFGQVAENSKGKELQAPG